ncbi:MAG: putative signal transducing protein [Limisphaerales bacterium]
MKLVTVVRTFSPAEAQLIRSRLEAAGIPAWVNHEAAALAMEGYSMSTGGVLVQTDEGHRAEARALLDLPPIPEDDTPASAAPALEEADPSPAEPERVTIFQTLDPTEADLTRSRLEAAGFEVFLTHESAPLYLSPITSGTIQVQVLADQAADALALISPPSQPDEPKA